MDAGLRWCRMSLFCDSWRWGGLCAQGRDSGRGGDGPGLGARGRLSLGLVGRAAGGAGRCGRAAAGRSGRADGLGRGEDGGAWWRGKGAVAPGGEQGVEAGGELAHLGPEQEGGRKRGQAAPLQAEQHQYSPHRPLTGERKRGQQWGEWRGILMH